MITDEIRLGSISGRPTRGQVVRRDEWRVSREVAIIEFESRYTLRPPRPADLWVQLVLVLLGIKGAATFRVRDKPAASPKGSHITGVTPPYLDYL